MAQTGAPTRSSKTRFLRAAPQGDAPRALLAPPAKPPVPKAALPKPVPKKPPAEPKRALLVPVKKPAPVTAPPSVAPPAPTPVSVAPPLYMPPKWLQKVLASIPPPPPPPENVDVPMLRNSDREKLFGRFTFKATPSLSDPERVFIDPAWISKNIVTRQIPSLATVAGVPRRGIELHELVMPHFEALVAAWEAEGLLPLILTWNGGFVPRFRRGQADAKVLSAHSWGSAFDFNARWNPFRKKPAPLGTEGSVIKLVTVAKKLGWVWGGDWRTFDGMHLEAGAALLGIADKEISMPTMTMPNEIPETSTAEAQIEEEATEKQIEAAKDAQIEAQIEDSAIEAQIENEEEEPPSAA